jgi:hypothetical protein
MSIMHDYCPNEPETVLISALELSWAEPKGAEPVDAVLRQRFWAYHVLLVLFPVAVVISHKVLFNL